MDYQFRLYLKHKNHKKYCFYDALLNSDIFKQSDKNGYFLLFSVKDGRRKEFSDFIKEYIEKLKDNYFELNPEDMLSLDYNIYLSTNDIYDYEFKHIYEYALNFEYDIYYDEYDDKNKTMIIIDNMLTFPYQEKVIHLRNVRSMDIKYDERIRYDILSNGKLSLSDNDRNLINKYFNNDSEYTKRELEELEKHKNEIRNI
jgi:predicted CopG family antitoxin